MTANRGDASAADPFDGLPLLIPVPRAAKLLGISRAAAYRFASAGDLPDQASRPPRVRRVGQAARVHRDGGRRPHEGARVQARQERGHYRFDIDPDPLTGQAPAGRPAAGSSRRREAWKACRNRHGRPRARPPGQLVLAAQGRRGRLDEWLSRIEHSIKPSMTQNWRNYAAYYVIPYIGLREVQDITGAVCDALYAKLLAEGRVKARPKKRPTTRAVHVRRLGPGGRPLPCRPTAMTPCDASTPMPRTIRR